MSKIETTTYDSGFERDIIDTCLRAESLHDLLDQTLETIAGWTGMHNLGIRVMDWLGNIPYETYRGFSRQFWKKENWLSATKTSCICPRVIMQNPDPIDIPGMTGGGSFLCGDTFAFVKGVPKASLSHYRGNCWKSGFRTLAIIPLRLNGEVLGAVQLADTRPDALPLEKVEQIETLTPLIASTIKRFNIEEELRQSYDTRAVTVAISRLSLEDLSATELCDKALDIILAIPWLDHHKMGAGAIFLTDEEVPDKLVMTAQRHLPASLKKACRGIPFGKCLCGEAAQKQEIVFAAGVEQGIGSEIHHGRFPKGHGHYCVPIVSSSRVTMGVINVYVGEDHRRSDKEELSLWAIANTLSVALQRKAAEAELWLANELLERMFDSTGLLVAYLDKEFNFIRVNRSYATKVGLEPEYFTGKNHFELYPDEENRAIFQRVLDTGEPYDVKGKPFEYPDHPEWGATYWDWNLQLVHEPDENAGGLVLSLIDTTERENAQIALRESNLELALAYDATLEGWSRALDLRDKETEGHTQRVTEMTVRLARTMGIGGEELVHVRRGALLHDIGKMGIPDAILLKPGKLTEDEWRVMRMHPIYAAQLLSPIPFLKPALEIPYYHHERWDGTGYPSGLAGEQIPLPARIFAIVDVWDALSSHRPYRHAWPRMRVLEHISEESGTHFDPDVVDVFLQMISGCEDVEHRHAGKSLRKPRGGGKTTGARRPAARKKAKK